MTYTIEGNSNPRVALSLGINGEVNIHPDPDLEASSYVWIKASDPDGNSAWAKFLIRLQAAYLNAIHASYKTSMAANTSQVITARVVDQWDRLWTGELTVRFWSSWGKVNPEAVVTSTGQASTTFSPGSKTGTAEVDAWVDSGPNKNIYIEVLGAEQNQIYLPLILRQ